MLSIIERWFGLYTPTVRRYLTTYYIDLERKGKLTGEYFHFDFDKDEWVKGPYPDLNKQGDNQ